MTIYVSAILKKIKYALSLIIISLNKKDQLKASPILLNTF